MALMARREAAPCVRTESTAVELDVANSSGSNLRGKGTVFSGSRAFDIKPPHGPSYSRLDSLPRNSPQFPPLHRVSACLCLPPPCPFRPVANNPNPHCPVRCCCCLCLRLAVYRSGAALCEQRSTILGTDVQSPPTASVAPASPRRRPRPAPIAPAAAPPPPHSQAHSANMCTKVVHTYGCGHQHAEKAPCATSRGADCRTLNVKTVKHDEKCESCDH